MCSYDNNPEMRKRLIICYDGTWYRGGGRFDFGQNQSNIFRIHASIKEGVVTLPHSDEKIVQVKRYHPGIGTSGRIVNRVIQGVLATEFRQQLEHVYSVCCHELRNENDELWLYGFSRGAYLVRALAAYFQSHPLPTGRLPNIVFVGAFDTVKSMPTEHASEHTIKSNVQHFRHALALNEERIGFTPKYDFHCPPLPRTSVQAWFIGTHCNIGGAARHDGLSLYPLQWMLAESRAQGLVLEFSPPPQPPNMENPLEVVFNGQKRTTYLKTGMTVQMWDLANCHDRKSRHADYRIKLDYSAIDELLRLESRRLFESSTMAECSASSASGTIIHPSVYLLLDSRHGEHLNIQGLRQRVEPFRELISDREIEIFSATADEIITNLQFSTIIPTGELEGYRAQLNATYGCHGNAEIRNLFVTAQNRSMLPILNTARKSGMSIYRALVDDICNLSPGTSQTATITNGIHEIFEAFGISHENWKEIIHIFAHALGSKWFSFQTIILSIADATLSSFHCLEYTHTRIEIAETIMTCVCDLILVLEHTLWHMAQPDVNFRISNALEWYQTRMEDLDQAVKDFFSGGGFYHGHTPLYYPRLEDKMKELVFERRFQPTIGLVTAA